MDTADEITAQLKDGIPSGESINRTRRTFTQPCFWTLKTRNDTIGANCHCQTPSTLEPTSRPTASINLLHDSAQPHVFTSFSCMCLTYQEVKFIYIEAHKRDEDKKNLCFGNVNLYI
jgi:hypothetical protein